jgi:hypothetical protein
MIGSTTEHDDETGKKKAQDSNDLNRREDELGLAVYFYGEDIQTQDDRNDYPNPNRGIVFLVLIPERDEDGGSGNLGTESN